MFSFRKKETMSVPELQYAHITGQGGREYNEDSFDIMQGKQGNCRFILADGLGGHGNGGVASKLVVESILREECEEPLCVSLERYFVNAQNVLIKEKRRNDEYREMMTTAVVLENYNNKFVWGHVGDSRLYYFEKRKIVERTMDHSVPQVMVATGEMKETEIRHHPDRNRLLRSMGSEWDKPQCQISGEKRQEGSQQFLLCSDGFWENVLENQMEETLAESEDPAEWLQKMEKILLSNDNNKDMDNYTAIAVWSQR